MAGTYELQLVLLSIVVASIASYTALDLAGRVSSARGLAAWFWLVGGAFSMGTGIWSMHFIGMLAFHLPIAVAYNLPLTLLSMLIAIGASGLALYVVKRPAMTGSNIVIGATLMGVGISSMHYTGMAAMQMSPGISYRPTLFLASVIIAIVASLAALWVAYQLRQKYSALAILAKLGSAFIMGLAITGMHYTGMAAAQFAPDAICLAADSTGGMDSGTLAMLIGVVTLGVLLATLALSAVDGHYAVRSRKLADSLRSANAQLRNIALYDSLTGLPNRMLLEDRIEHCISRSERSGKPFAVMFVDLDRFKPVNDTYGHAAGDELLRVAAKRLSACVRKEDTVARTGGDEFVLVLSEIAEARDAELIGRKILGEVANPFFILGNEMEISCSIGINTFPDGGSDIPTLLAHADVAMYHAKKAGRNKSQLFLPEMKPGSGLC
jgi:diguanylate cyclase (GGDEF)-like protein